MISEALVVAEPGSPFVYQEIEVDDILRDNEVLVEMKATGVCHTDLNFRNEKSIPGLHPAVLGHEGNFNSRSLGNPPSLTNTIFSYIPLSLKHRQKHNISEST